MFKVPLYGARVLLMKSDPEAFMHELRRWDDTTNSRDTPSELDGQALLMTSKEGSPIIVIWLRHTSQMKNPYWIGVLAHECYHGVSRFLNKVGMPAGKDSEEAFAYLHGWLVQQCLERLQRPTPRRRKGKRKK